MLCLLGRGGGAGREGGGVEVSQQSVMYSVFVDRLYETLVGKAEPQPSQVQSPNNGHKAQCC